MTHLRDLLVEAAPRPVATPLLERLQARAASRRRRRRLVVWCAGATALVGLGIPSGSLVLNAASPAGVDVQAIDKPRVGDPAVASDADSRRTLRGVGLATNESDPSRTATEADRRPDPSRSGRLQTPVAVTSVGPRAASPSSSPTTAAVAPSSGGGGTAEEGCALPEPPGTDRDEGSCSYVASRPGGYVGSGSWTVLIVRNGQELRYSSVDSPSCAPTGFIRPGDEVHANLGSGAGDRGGGVYVVPQDSMLRVGPAERCP